MGLIDRAREKFLEYTEDFAGQFGQDVLARVKNSGLPDKAVSTLTDALQKKVLTPETLDKVINSSTLKNFINSPKAKEMAGQVLDVGKKIGFGAASQLFDGLSNDAYQQWLLENPVPKQPGDKNIEQYVKVANNEKIDHYECASCGKFYDKPVSSCSGCLGNEISAYGVNPEWTRQKRLIEDWEEKSKAKQEELGIKSSGIDSEQIGMILFLVASGGGMSAAVMTDAVRNLFNPDNSGEGDLPAQEMVAASLRGEAVSKHQTDQIDNTRIEGANPKELFKELKAEAQEEFKLNKYENTFGGGEVILAKNVQLTQGSAINGTIICLGDCWFRGITPVTITGDLVLFGRLTSIKLPKVEGTIYLVKDKVANVFASVNQPGLIATECTVDKAYQLAHS